MLWDFSSVSRMEHNTVAQSRGSSFFVCFLQWVKNMYSLRVWFRNGCCCVDYLKYRQTERQCRRFSCCSCSVHVTSTLPVELSDDFVSLEFPFSGEKPVQLLLLPNHHPLRSIQNGETAIRMRQIHPRATGYWEGLGRRLRCPVSEVKLCHAYDLILLPNSSSLLSGLRSGISRLWSYLSFLYSLLYIMWTMQPLIYSCCGGVFPV